MNYQKWAILALMVASLIFTFLSNSYPTALIFVASSGLLGFLEFNTVRNDNELKQIRQEVKHLATRVEQMSLAKRMGR